MVVADAMSSREMPFEEASAALAALAPRSVSTGA